MLDELEREAIMTSTEILEANNWPDGYANRVERVLYLLERHDEIELLRIVASVFEARAPVPELEPGNSDTHIGPLQLSRHSTVGGRALRPYQQRPSFYEANCLDS